jgi:predicted nucleic acid-binding protein
LADRLGSINDLLIALTARHMGATVVTSNLQEFYQISVYLSGLKIAAPEDRAL